MRLVSTVVMMMAGRVESVCEKDNVEDIRSLQKPKVPALSKAFSACCRRGDEDEDARRLSFVFQKALPGTLSTKLAEDVESAQLGGRESYCTDASPLVVIVF
jgi:hypothetical protein